MHNSDFAHNKTRGYDSTPGVYFGGWSVVKKDSLRAELIAAQAGPYHSALRLVSQPDETDKKNPWGLRMFQRVGTPPVPSDNIMLRVWMRSPDRNCVEVNVDQHDRQSCRVAIRSLVMLTPEWKEYTFRGIPGGGPRDVAWVNFELGKCPGTVEITGICLSLEAPSRTIR